MEALLFPSLTSAVPGSTGPICTKDCQLHFSSHVLAFTVAGSLEFRGGHPVYSVILMTCTFKQMASQKPSAEQKGSTESVYPVVTRDIQQDVPSLSLINTSHTPCMTAGISPAEY